MTTRRIISGSRPASLLIGRILFNYNRIFNGFEFIFSNFKTGSGIITLAPPRPDYILKIIFYYFIFIL